MPKQREGQRVVRYDGRICCVLSAWPGWLRIQPAYEHPITVRECECQSVAMTVVTPGSKDYWPAIGRGPSRGDPDA